MREHEMPARDSASLVSSAARGVADGNLLGSAHELVIVDTLNTPVSYTHLTLPTNKEV